MLRPIALATLVSGTLDILWAITLTVWRGREPGNMLRFVASGPYPSAVDMGPAGAFLGLLTHFAIMAVIVAIFVITARRLPQLTRNPLLWGTLYGLATYAVMNLVVVPLRFPEAWPPTALSVVTQLFAHIMLVGLPIALITAITFRRGMPSRS